jgi:hypothetical protein
MYAFLKVAVVSVAHNCTRHFTRYVGLARMKLSQALLSSTVTIASRNFISFSTSH